MWYLRRKVCLDGEISSSTYNLQVYNVKGLIKTEKLIYENICNIFVIASFMKYVKFNHSSFYQGFLVW